MWRKPWPCLFPLDKWEEEGGKNFVWARVKKSRPALSLSQPCMLLWFRENTHVPRKKHLFLCLLALKSCALSLALVVVLFSHSMGRRRQRRFRQLLASCRNNLFYDMPPSPCCPFKKESAPGLFNSFGLEVCLRAHNTTLQRPHWLTITHAL